MVNEDYLADHEGDMMMVKMVIVLTIMTELITMLVIMLITKGKIM